MKRKNILVSFILALAALTALASVSISAKGTITIGSTLENFKLFDSNGKEQSFNDLKGKNGAIIVFLSTKCPVVKGYNERISKLAEDFQAKGINVIGINSNYSETAEEIKKHTDEHYKFPVLIDKNNVIADELNAFATPQVFLFDGNNKLVYFGAIDNDRTGENVSINFLRTALDEQLAGKAISKPETKAIGCTIQKIAKGAN